MRTKKGVGAVVLAAAFLLASAGSAQTQPPRGRAAGTDPRSPSYLGIGVVDIGAERARALNLKGNYGVEVSNVAPGGPAAKAGIQVGDVILGYNGQPVLGSAQLQLLVRVNAPGRQVKLSIWRNGGTQTVTATLAARPETADEPLQRAWPAISLPSMPPMDIPTFITIMPSGMLGIFGEPLGQQMQLAEFFGVKDGVLVKEVIHDSPAERAGIRAGDVIVKVDDNRVGTTREITGALRGGRGKRTFTVTVVRNKKEVSLPVTLEIRTGLLFDESPELGG